MIAVIVCGGRNYADYNAVAAFLDVVRESRGELHIIQGGASGADRLAYSWARARRQTVTTVWADWDKHGKSAGPIRNQRMLDDFKPELVVAFPGGRGTADMVERARRRGVTVIVGVRYERNQMEG